MENSPVWRINDIFESLAPQEPCEAKGCNCDSIALMQEAILNYLQEEYNKTKPE